MPNETVEQLAERIVVSEIDVQGNSIVARAIVYQIEAWLRDNRWVQLRERTPGEYEPIVQTPESENPDTPTQSPFSREQVAEALVLLPEASKNPLTGGSVLWPYVLGRLPDPHFGVLRRVGESVGATNKTHWVEAYRLIASAHGLPKLGEGEAKLPSIEELDSMATSDLSQWASPENDWSDFAPTPPAAAVMEAKPCGLDRTIAERVMRHQRINANPSEEFMASVVAELLAPQRAAAKQLQAKNERLKAQLEHVVAELEWLRAGDRVIDNAIQEKQRFICKQADTIDALQAQLNAAEERVKVLTRKMQNAVLLLDMGEYQTAGGGEEESLWDKPYR